MKGEVIMTIIYFTSTGNCLSVASKLGGRYVSIPQALKANEFNYKDDKIGVVFPVYGLCTPPLVAEFLKKAKFECDYLFAIITYGFYAGATVTNMQRVAGDYSFDYINTLNMTENYLPGFKMEDEKNKNKKTEEKLNLIINDVLSAKHYIKKDSALDRFMTWTHMKKYAYPLGIGYSESYEINDNCIGCGICSKVCPMGNISINDGKPEFSMDCSSCLACIQNCPQNALHMKQEKSSERYRNKEITLAQIIEANDQTC